MTKLKWQMFFIESGMFFGVAAIYRYGFHQSDLTVYFATALLSTLWFKWRHYE